MSDLLYASIVIVIIWAGIFLWVLKLDRRLRKIENSLPGNSTTANVTLSGAEPATELAVQPADSNQATEASTY